MSITLQEANAAIDSINSAYFGIVLKKFYIPKRTSSIITADYLLKVMTDRVFRIMQSEVKIGGWLLDKASSQQLWSSFQVIQIGKPWGFDQFHIPNKNWMINVQYTHLNPIILYKKIQFQSAFQYYPKMISRSYNHLTHPFGSSKQGRFFSEIKSLGEFIQEID